MHLKNINAVFKNGFNPVLGSIPRLPIIDYYTKLDFLAKLNSTSLFGMIIFFKTK